MQITDAVADMLTRIRNAGKSKHGFVDVPSSNLKKAIAKVLLDEDSKQGIIRITLKYSQDKKSVIAGIKRISKPGLRVYADKEKMPKVLGGIGIAIVSTSKGVMTDRKARENGVGGEVLAFVW